MMVLPVHAASWTLQLNNVAIIAALQTLLEMMVLFVRYCCSFSDHTIVSFDSTSGLQKIDFLVFAQI